MSEQTEESPLQEPEPDNEPEPEQEPDEPSAPEPEQTPAEAAAAEGSADIPKKLERAIADQKKRIGKILGIDLDGAECPTCGGMGYTTGPQAETVDFKEDPSKEACPTCNGLGQLISHSRAPGHELVTCIECAGQGWRMKPNPVTNVAQLPVAPPSAQAAQMGQLLPDGTFLPFGASEPIRVGQPAG